MLFLLKFKEAIDEEKFFASVYKKGNLKDALVVTKAFLKNFKLFCMDTYGEELHDALTQSKTEERDNKVFNFLNDFIDCMYVDHPKVLWKRSPVQKKGSILKKKSVKSMCDYISFARKYMKRYYSLNIDNDDYIPTNC